MAIENPAAIFSEAGLKIFLEAILKAKSEADLVGTIISNGNNGNSGHNGDNGDNAEVEALVTEYKKYKKIDNAERMKEITEIITDFMKDGRVVVNGEIFNFLKSLGYEYGPRSIGPVMRGVCKRNPDIEKISKTQYQFKAVVNT